MLNNKHHHSWVLLPVLLLLLCTVLQGVDEKKPRLNFLLITVDDMNWDSIGVNGCKVAGISPNIDRLASQGLLFNHAHVTIAVCMPTRAVWMTGRYPHRNGALGFQKINPGVPTLLEALKKAGYYTGILAKVPHVVPSRGQNWDVVVQGGDLAAGRDPVLYARHSGKFFAAAKTAGKPFFLMANSQDPHRPFAKSQQEAARKNPKPKKNKNPAREKKNQARKSSKFPEVKNPYTARDIKVPAFLPALDKVKTEMAQYYTSVRRADRITGAVLGELDKAGLAGNTLVMFLSDHGMPLPFAKTNCYYHSTRTPWIVRLPGVTKPGSVDRRNMISGIDLAPTVLDILGLEPLVGMDGRSFRPLLSGKEQSGRERIFTHFHRTAGKRDYPMRSVLTRRYGYIYNGWAGGETVFKNESQNGLTMAAMKAAARNNSSIAARVKLFLYRVPEELYDYEKDPDALHNLIGDPVHKERVEGFRRQLAGHMKGTADPQLAPFNKLLGK